MSAYCFHIGADFLYEREAFDIEMPNETYITTTNAPSGGVGNLGSSADSCTAAYGKAPNVSERAVAQMGRRKTDRL